MLGLIDVDDMKRLLRAAIFPARCRLKSHRTGFSLIELMVTLVIVSILAAVTLPVFRNLIVERKTNVAALQVKSFLDAARARATARGRPVSVILERLSSRWEGQYSGAIPQSATANNAPTNLTDNYEVYNTCIRLVMAETLNDMEIDTTVLRTLDDEAGTIPAAFQDADGISENDRVLAIQNVDNRLRATLIAGNEISLSLPNDQVVRFQITGPSSVNAHPANPAYFLISIHNEGTPALRFGTLQDVNRAAASQFVFQPHVALPVVSPSVSPIANFETTLINRIRIASRPRPIASMVAELPRGTCIDLSLSGLAADDPNVNVGVIPPPLPFVLQHYRDCRREFASDWIAPPPAIPTPQELRPVYLTFGPGGKLQSILSNGPSSPTLRRIEPQSDVCLFIGRTDQVVRAIGTSDLAAAEDERLKPNLLDQTGYWVRISPSSGAVSAAPAQASHIIEDVAEFRAGNPPEPVGHLLQDSRELIFGAELSSQ